MEKGYNLQNINELSGSDDGFIATLVKTFLEEVPSDLDYMVQAIEANNRGRTYQYVHKMKPNLQLFGMNLSSHIKEVETWSKNNTDKKAIQSTLHQIVTTINTAIKDLKKDFSS